MTFASVSPSELRLPDCPIPRPGDRVCWYTGGHPVSGLMTGHDIDGEAKIIDEFGNGITKRFEEIRLRTPLARVGPNWCSLPSAGKLLRPNDPTRARFAELLGKLIPPGLRYIDLATEIWSRGFEIFLVGGTVRDVLSGAAPNDVDFVTTMPLERIKKILPSMLRYTPTLAKERGYVRIGGKPESGDPFVDLKVFSNSLVGTPEATFGVGFERDVAHRDFACNAVYYDPINEILIDPTGIGVADAQASQLSLICASADVHQYAQIFIRTFKFSLRGFTITPPTLTKLKGELAQAIPSMNNAIRVRYLRTQLFGKCKSTADHGPVLDEFKRQMAAHGLEAIWTIHFEPIAKELLP
jgi:hypothetical protein